MSDKERISFLRKELAKHNHSYYVLDTPLISDFEFDNVNGFNQCIQFKTKKVSEYKKKIYY